MSINADERYLAVRDVTAFTDMLEGYCEGQIFKDKESRTAKDLLHCTRPELPPSGCRPLRWITRELISSSKSCKASC